MKYQQHILRRIIENHRQYSPIIFMNLNRKAILDAHRDIQHNCKSQKLCCFIIFVTITQNLQDLIQLKIERHSQHPKSQFPFLEFSSHPIPSHIIASHPLNPQPPSYPSNPFHTHPSPFINNNQMSIQPIQKLSQVPLPDQLRKRTDLPCALFSFLFSTSLFIYCCVISNKDNVYKTNFPADSDGKQCGIDYPAYKYLYFPDLYDTAKRVCVSECPTENGGGRLKCMPTEAVGCKIKVTPESFEYYNTQAENTRLGMFCLPKSDRIRRELLKRSHLDGMAGFMDATDIILLCCLTSVLLGVLYLAAVQALPQCMNYVSVILGSLSCAALANLLHRQPSNTSPSLKLTLTIILIAITLLLVLSLVIFSKHLTVNGIFLNHSTRFVASQPSVLLHILTFMVFTGGLLAVTVFQFLAVWGEDPPGFEAGEVYYRPKWTRKAVGLSVVIGVQLYWGLAFLKQLFNFIVSGNAINYYFHLTPNHCQPLSRVLRFHFGSIVLGSFMTGFFSLGDTLFQLLRPHSQGCYSKCFNPLCGWLSSLFQLVRSDAMAYINLTGMGYCEAAKSCEMLCRNSHLFRSSQSVSRFYRLGGHMLLAFSVLVFGMVFRRQVGLMVWLLVFVMAVFLTTYFVSLHADAAEAMGITFLTEEYIQSGNMIAVNRAPDALVADLMAV